MITLAELKAKARRKYEQVLQAYLSGKDLFPLPVPSDKTLNREAGGDAVFEQQRELLEHSKNKTGRGYSLAFSYNRTTRQSEIRKISFETAADLLFFIDKEDEYQAFAADVERVRAVFPTLLDVFLGSPHLL